MNISHQFFNYKITLVNSPLENSNSTGDFGLKNYLNFSFKFFSDSDFVWQIQLISM